MLDRININPSRVKKTRIRLILNTHFISGPFFRFSLKDENSGRWALGVVDKEVLYAFALELFQDDSVRSATPLTSNLFDFTVKLIESFESGAKANEPYAYAFLKEAMFWTSVGMQPYSQDPDLTGVVANALAAL